MVERENEGSGPRRSSVVGMDEGDSAVALEGESAMKAIFPDFDDWSEAVSSRESNGAIVLYEMAVPSVKGSANDPRTERMVATAVDTESMPTSSLIKATIRMCPSQLALASLETRALVKS